MNTVQATGRLRHRFWGEYSAAVVLFFNSKEAATDAHKVLSNFWKISDVDNKALVAIVNSTELNELKDELEKYGADKSKIDSIAKSIDYGEPFSVEIPVVAHEQMCLPID